MQSIIIIAVATAALLEMVQLVLPISEVLSAGFLGIILALGIGWEEKTFHGVATNPSSVAEILSESEWDAPKMEIPNNAYKNFNLSIAIFLLVTLFLAYVVDISNILLDGMD